MPISIILHVQDEDPVLCEVEQIPDPKDVTISVMNPRKRDGKDLHYVMAGVTNLIWPLRRINFIQVLPSEEEDKIIGFVRE